MRLFDEFQRPRLVVGRNYVETLLLTFTQIELMEGDVDTRLALTLRIEEEICALSQVSRVLRNEYHKALAELLREEFPDLPVPEFRECFASKKLREWVELYGDKIFKGRYWVEPTSELEKAKKELLARLLRTALMSALYATGTVSL